MTQNKKEAILQTLQHDGILPLFYHPDFEVAKAVLKAAYDGGSRIFEFTNRGEGALEVFKPLVAYAKAELPGLWLGIGTVYDALTAKVFIDNGADFVVQPIFNAAVGTVCQEAGIPWFPGVSTLTEIYNARLSGADIVKLFPGDVLGSKFIKAIKGPMSDARIVVTGGVKPTHESLKEWFDAGAYAVGLGSNLFPKDLIETGNFEQITGLVRDSLAIAANVRQR
ncbi:bifunctional 4-hydroxy-2-oxoglutarate aldolase/2-dehydro-3-deoxy-phosphogluconate aldolase [Ravibacter arvi]|uniref:Bifunctional 4-hydroxy-2-oxoglutarate aldolase/2-dehydro-3-deoxy-phosphogluconate aldolase n=1 Tax=Ravibacter arvi TaxID=2051041 RepID=A0ABP8LQX8_9BACT